MVVLCSVSVAVGGQFPSAREHWHCLRSQLGALSPRSQGAPKVGVVLQPKESQACPFSMITMSNLKPQGRIIEANSVVIYLPVILYGTYMALPLLSILV